VHIHVFNKARWNIVANEGLLYSFIQTIFRATTLLFEIPDSLDNPGNLSWHTGIFQVICIYFNFMKLYFITYHWKCYFKKCIFNSSAAFSAPVQEQDFWGNDSNFHALGSESNLIKCMTSFWVYHQSQQFLISYSPIHITTCFGLYRPSSGEIYTVVF
jgi:hypothetical protein